MNLEEMNDKIYKFSIKVRETIEKNREYQKDIEILESKNKEYITDIDILELKNKELELKVEVQETTIKKLKEEIENLKINGNTQNKTQEEKKEINDLNNDISVFVKKEEICEVTKTLKENLEDDKISEEIFENEVEEFDEKNALEIIKNKINIYSDINKLTRLQWRTILEFGEKEKILTNDEVKKINDLMVRIRFDITINDENFKEMEKVLEKIKASGFEISLLTLNELDNLSLIGKDAGWIGLTVYKQLSSFLSFFEKYNYFSQDHYKFMTPFFRRILSKINNDEPKKLEINEFKEKETKIRLNHIEINEDNTLEKIKNKINTYSIIKEITFLQWKQILKFAKENHILNNIEIRDLENLMTRLRQRMFIEKTILYNAENILKKIKDNGFEISLLTIDELDDLYLLGKDNGWIDLITYKRFASFLSFFEKYNYFSRDQYEAMIPYFRKILLNIDDDNFKESKIIEPQEEIIEETRSFEQEYSEEEDEEKFLEEVRNFKYNEWIQMYNWAKENYKLTNKDLKLLSSLATRIIYNQLSEKEAILGLELYSILKSEGFNFISPLVDEKEQAETELSEENTLEYQLGDRVELLAGGFRGEKGIVTEIDLEEELVTVKIKKFGRNIETEVELDQVEIIEKTEMLEDSEKEHWNFDKLLMEGLKTGHVKNEWIQSIDFDEELEVSDYYEVLEELENKDIKVI